MRWSSQIVKRIVNRAQIGIDLFAHVAGQEAEPLARFHRRPRQDDAIDFLALEQLHGMRDRQPGLAGAGGAGAENQRMAAQRADIGVLRGGARAHRALAQIQLFEIRPRGGGVEIEQRALSDGEPYRAFHVSRGEIVAALEIFIKAFEHAPRLFAGIAGAFDGDVIAARVGDHVEPPLDQREVLPVLAEQRRSESIVFKGQHDLRRRAALARGQD